MGVVGGCEGTFMSVAISDLFSPLILRGVTLKNRIAVSPMCQYSSVDGFANDWHFVHLGTRAVGGAGLVFTEATAVTPEGRISPHDLGIYQDAHIEMLQKITTFIMAQGSVPGIQLAHAGRKASVARPWEGGDRLQESEGGWQPVAPSAIAFSDKSLLPMELSDIQIQNLIQAFVTAAERARQANFKVIEIHAAHGYLLHEFLSPISNVRHDRYGGSFENRTRLLCEIVANVRDVWPKDYPIFVRVSATEWDERGWTLHDTVNLAKLLKEKGVDLIDCSSGGNIVGANIPIGSGYQTGLAAQVRREAHIATGAIGLITSAIQADHIVRTEQADLIFLAREMLRDPYFPWRAARELKREHSVPVQYQRAK